MKYVCESCDFYGRDKYSYSRHLLSKRHQDTSYKNIKYICDGCNETLSTSYNLDRHKKSCPNFKKKENDAKIKEIIESYEVMIKDLEHKQIQEKVLLLEEENKNLKKLINTIPSSKMSMSALKFVNIHYSNAPVLEPIKDLSLIHSGLSLDSFVEKLITEHRNKRIPVYIGNIITEYYQTDDPGQQSLWNTDVDRLTYLVRAIMSNDQLYWKVDKKGVDISTTILDPIMEYIDTHVRDFIKDYKIGSKLIDIEIANSRITILHDLLRNIKNGKIQLDIMKHISARLYIDKDLDPLPQ